MTDNDSSASGYLTDSFEGISQVFTDVEILGTSEVNIVAKAKRYGRWWLLKGLRPEVAGEAAYQQRLRKELEILMRLQHPGIVNTSGLEEVKDLGLCIVMEYVDGVTLKEWIQEKPTRREQRRIAMELTETVGYVHSCGIVHRDLKPENIIITHNGQNVKLIDFGLADTDSHAILKQPAGTAEYMSPEQRQTATADVRNDIYSLGVIFGKMDLGYGFRRIINKCQKSIEQRYQNIDSLMDAMRKDEPKLKQVLIVCFLILSFMAGFYVFTQMRSLRNIYTQDQSQHQAVERAISDGKAVIDKAIEDDGIAQHMDTLSSVIFLRPDFAEKMTGEVEIYNQYMASLKGQYSESELNEISSVLMQYLENRQKVVYDKFNKLKKEYDDSFMQGY